MVSSVCINVHVGRGYTTEKRIYILNSIGNSNIAISSNLPPTIL